MRFDPMSLVVLAIWCAIGLAALTVAILAAYGGGHLLGWWA